MKRTLQGRYVKVATAGEAFKAFVPAPLPPRPVIVWTPALRGRFDTALQALGRLDAVTDLLPNAALLLYSFVRKEAVLSSMVARVFRRCCCGERHTGRHVGQATAGACVH